jgi:hypothetical protein
LLGKFCGRVQRGTASGGKALYDGDRRKQLPAEAPGQAGVSQDVLLSKNLINHLKAFDMAFYYINYGTV